MNDTFKVIRIQPSLPCVYHGCEEEAKVAIAYAVSEREWRIVPTCERHTVDMHARRAEETSGAAHLS